MIFYTRHSFLTRGMDGYSYGFFAVIRESKRWDISLLRHEEEHLRQFRASWGLSFFLYYLFDERRLQYEAQAYAKSVDNGMPILTAARCLCSLYGLKGLTEQEAIEEIYAYITVRSVDTSWSPRHGVGSWGHSI